MLFIALAPAALAQSQRPEQNKHPIFIKDFYQNEIVLTQPAKRIVALAPHIVENLFSIGAGHLIVGTVEYANFPSAANEIPRVGAISSFSLEAIASLNPDLVILWPAGKSEKLRPKLKELGLKTYVNDPKSLEDIARTILDFGQLTGQVNESEAVALKYQKKLSSLQDKVKHLTPKPKLFYQVWHQPIQTLNRQSMISKVIEFCGAENIFANAPNIAPIVSLESIIALDPDAIIASGSEQVQPIWLDKWKKYPQLRAVKNNHLFDLPADFIERPTIRILEGTQRICDAVALIHQSREAF